MSENTPKLDVEAIWARLDAATPAPWKDDGDVSGIVADSGERVTEGDNSGYGCVYISDADRALIAHAPTDLRRLLDENARLNAENERLSTLRDALAMKLGGVLTIVPQLRHIVGDGTRSEMELLDAVEVLIDKALPAAPEMPRPPAVEAHSGTETLGTGSGRGTGVAAASETAQAIELVPGVWISSGRQNGKTAATIAAAVAAAKPAHYREAAASLRKIADADEKADPPIGGEVDYLRGWRHAANRLDSVAKDLDDEAPSLPVPSTEEPRDG